MNSMVYARIIGTLFITATTTGLLSAIFLGTTLEDANSYQNSINENQIYLVAFFER